MMPLICVIVFSQTVGVYMGFIEITANAIDIWILGMLAFWLGGAFVLITHRKKTQTANPHSYASDAKKGIGILNIVCGVFLSISVVDLYASLRMGMLEKGDFGAHGLVGHISNFIMGFFIYYVICLRKNIETRKRLTLFFLVAIFFLKLMTGIRGNIVLPILGSFIGLIILRELRITIKSVVIAVIAVLSLFIGTSLIFQSGKMEMAYAPYYVNFYITSGVVGLSGYMEAGNPTLGINQSFIFSFWKNLYKAIVGSSGEYASVIQEDWTSVSDAGCPFPFSTNTYTLIGEVFINEGYTLGILYFVFLGIFSYILYLNAFKSIYMTVAYCCVASCLFLGMFGQYTLGIFFHTTTLLFVLFHFVSKTRGNYGIRCNSYCV